jgi:hypothetical protein
MKNLAAILSTLLLVSSAICQDTKQDNSMADCTSHQQHSGQAHHAIVESHGDKAMGFPHDRTIHHFRLSADGGTIEVAVNDPTDKANIQAIRSHLSHIAVMFASGDFSTPMFIHDDVPPGTTTMTLMKSSIRYTYQETQLGGNVELYSTEPIAIAAIHDFLRFQITDHQTGDTLEVLHR